MSLSDGEFEFQTSRFIKILTPFLVFNVVASIFLILIPLAVPVFCAEFCLLAIWSAWGPGDFWRRFGTCLVIGGVLLATQAYLWIIVAVMYQHPFVIGVAVQWVFSAWIMAQIPLWGLRYIWQWRITNDPAADLGRFSVNDNIIGLTMICAALASCRWATDQLVETYSLLRPESLWQYYGWALLEFYLLMALAGLGAWLSFRLRSLPLTIIPLIVLGAWFSVLSAWLWFTPPDWWIVSGVLWCGTILFSWAVVLTMRYISGLGYRLYIGSRAVSEGIESGG